MIAESQMTLGKAAAKGGRPLSLDASNTWHATARNQSIRNYTSTLNVAELKLDVNSLHIILAHNGVTVRHRGLRTTEAGYQLVAIVFLYDCAKALL